MYNLIEYNKKSTKQYPTFYRYDNEVGQKDSVKIVINSAKNSFFTHNDNAKGTVVDFVKYVENVDFVTAVKKIANYYNLDVENENVEFNSDFVKNNVNLQRSINIKKEAAKATKEAEQKAAEWINKYSNLRINRHFDNDIRAISKDLLNYLRDENKIKYYKTDKYAVIKVPLYSNSNTLCGGQDIYKDASGKWQKINHGRAGIYYTGNLKNVTTLTLTESVFDSLSALQIKYDKTKAKNPYYTFDDLNSDLATVSVNGSLSDLKKAAILDVIKNSGNLQTIIYAFDNDEVGKKYEKEITELFKNNGILDKYDIVAINYGTHKDLNEYLQAKKARESAAPDNHTRVARAVGEREKVAEIAH